MENYGHLNHFAEQTFRALFYLLWPCLAICSVYCSYTNTSALNICFNFQLYNLSLLALLQYEQFMRHLIFIYFQVTLNSLLQQCALASFKPLHFSVTQPGGSLRHDIFFLQLRCCKKNAVMEGSILDMLDRFLVQSLLLLCICIQSFNASWFPLIFSSDSDSSQSNTRWLQHQICVFSLVSVHVRNCLLLRAIFQCDASGIKCCNCTLYYKLTSVIPYTSASVHSYLTCLCFSILIGTGILRVNAFR